MPDYLNMLQGEQQPASRQQPNPYLSALEAEEQGRQQQFRASVETAVDVNPDKLSTQRRVAGYLGYPEAAVEALPQETERQAKVKRIDENTAGTPVLRQRYTDADFAKLAHDDSDALSSIETLFGSLKSMAKYIVSAPDAPRGGVASDVGKGARALLSSAPQAGSALYGVGAGFAGLADQYVQAIDDAAAFLTNTPRRQIVGSPGAESWLLGQQKEAGGVADRVMGADSNAGFIERSVLSGVQSGGQNLLTLPLGLAGKTQAMLAAMGLITGGQSYGKGRESGLSPLQAGAYAAQDATAEIVTEKFMGAAGLLKNIKAGDSAGRLFGYEVFKEIPGEIGATLWQNFNEWANVNPDKSVAEFISEQPEAVAQTIIATLVGGSVQIGAVHGARTVADRISGEDRRAQAAESAATGMAEMSRLAEASKLRQRDPESFKAFAEELVRDDVPNLYVDAQALMQSGVDLQALAQAMPAVADQIQEAAITGGDIVIPTADLLAVESDSTLKQSLIEHARTSPDAMSRAEAQAFIKDQGEAIKAEMELEMIRREQDMTWQMQRDEVAKEFQAQLDAAGRFQPEVNKQYASMLGSFYATQAERVGVTAQELAAKYPLQIRATAPQTGEQTLEQSVFHGTPHRGIDQFSTEAIGTGEGNQSYGWGLYFAGKRDIADWYRRMLSKGGKGQLYRVDIPEDDQFLLWDKPLNEQTDAVRMHARAIASSMDRGWLLHRLAKLNADSIDELNGDEFHSLLTSALNVGALPTDPGTPSGDAVAEGNVHKAVSMLMAEDGLKGIKYLDGTSRAAGDGSYNYVIFNGADTKIEETFLQGSRGQVTFGADITSLPSVISIFENADLSTVVHESGHFFLEVQADLAARIQAQILAGASVSEGEQQIVADMGKVLEWFGVKGSPEQSPIDQWFTMTLDEKRAMHEQFARGFEAYAFEGRAPSAALRGVFQRFAAWLKNVYRSMKSLNVSLTDEVRGVFDRMIATDDQIREAEQVRAMGPLFAEQGGMTPEQWAQYQELGGEATQEAVDQLQTRAIRDMKWLDNAKSKKLKELQKQADDLRREVRTEVQREVMSRQVYRAWQFLTGKGDAADTVKGEKTKASKEVDPEQDSLFVAIAKHGGLRKDEIVKAWGVDPKEKLNSGVFGKPVLRKDGGLSVDSMLERLAEDGYVLPDASGQLHSQALEELFDAERRGNTVYSVRRDYSSMLDVGAAALPDHFTHGKLSTEALQEQYGTGEKALWRVLSDRRMTSPSGLSPEVVAETFGYPSGDAMVRELVAAREPKAVIAELTDQQMLERYGDLGTPEGLQRATNEALANDARTRFVATEFRALEEAAGRGRTTADVMDRAAKEFAAQTISRMAVKDVKPAKFEAAAARAAKLAAKATKAGNLEEAAMHKRSELIQLHAVKAAYDALADIEKAQEFFRDVNNRSLDKIGKTRDVDVVQAMRAVLAEYGIGTKGERAQQYLEAVERNDPDMHKVLKDRMDAMMASAAPVESLSVDALRGLHDELGAMWHLALRSRQMEVDGNLIDRQEVQADLLERLKEIGIPDTVPGEGKAVTDKERRISRLREAMAALKRVENWAAAKDGGDNGAFTRYVFRPIKEAADAYRSDKAKALRQYRELLKGVDLGKARISAPELGYEFGYSKGGSGKAEILHAILHTGNESNKRKLLLGRGWATQLEDGTVDTGRWERFVERMIREGVLTKQDFDFAQGVWGLLESLKPLAQKTHRDVFGRYFDEITANPVTNSLGTWRGGYVPAMTDAEVVKDAKTRELAEAENSTMAFAFPSTAKGFTKARVEYNKPLLLDLRALAGHIDKVLLFSHMEQHVRDVRRVLTSNDVAEPLHRVDPSAFGSLITPWLNRAARQQVETPIPGDGGTMRVLSKLRSRAGIAAMFANVANAAQQVTGLSIAAVKVEPRHLMSAAARYISSPRKTAQSVAEASRYMADRMENEVSQMTQDINEILLNPSLYEKAQNWAGRHAYFMQSAVDNVIGPIVWTGAYNQALERGMSEEDARRFGDATVRQTQGSTLPEDVSRIETGNAWWRMFAQFAGYFNMQANLLGTEFQNQMRDLGLRKGAGKGLYVFMFGFLVPAMLSEMIVQAFRGGPGDEDKDGEYLDDWLSALTMGTIRSGVAMVPVVGQVVNYGINLTNTKPYDDRISTAPAISMIESAVRAPVSVYEAAVEDKSKQKAVRDLATLITLTTGLPANAVARPVGYLAGVSDDKIQPTGPVDAARGVVTGVASPDSK